jgi:hypothetical protein
MASSGRSRAAGAAIGVAAAVAAYGFLARPLHLRWGATALEVVGRWPGDELMPAPRSRAVRAVTIEAPAGGVWPWIMQIGRDRGGFYSYSWLENLIGADIQNVERLLGLPDRRPGETVWMGPEHRFGGEARMVVASIVGHAMVLVPPADAERVASTGRAEHGVWSFVIEAVTDRRTRLVMLSLGGKAMPGFGGWLGQLAFWEPAHFVMERRMMLTIKRLAEREAAGQSGPAGG